jgi:hypothetical protein
MEIPTQTPSVATSAMVLPVRCGMYHWGDEPVIVWTEDGELWGAAQYVGIEKVADIDREFRDDLAFHNLPMPEQPPSRNSAHVLRDLHSYIAEPALNIDALSEQQIEAELKRRSISPQSSKNLKSTLS